MSIVGKAEETVANTTPHAIEALGRIKFLLVGIPVICLIVGLLAQQVLPERNVVSATFKLGTFATPSEPEPVALAGESQMKARLRATAAELRKTDRDVLLLATLIENDVITTTATGLGPEATREFLRTVVQRELDFENGRLEKLQVVQTDRRKSLESQLAELSQRINFLTASQGQGSDAVALLALQQEIDNARGRSVAINNELNSMSLLNASDLFIDTSQFIREPFIIASSNWYRPILYGAMGLGAGLILVFLLAIVAIIRALTRKKDS